MRTAELVMEHSSTQMAQPTAAPTGIKTILFSVHNDDGLANRIQVALSMARAFGAHLHLLHVTPIEAYTVTDAYATFVSAEILKVLEKESANLKEKLEQQLSKEDVSWDYEELTGVLMPHLMQRAALADVVLTGRQPYEREFAGPAITLLGDMLHRIRTPLFIVGDEARDFDPFGRAIVAWNGSYEAASALRAAVPMLRLASQVRLISVQEPKEKQFPSTAALEYLSRHGIHAELVQRPCLEDSVQEELVDEATDDQADYMVMGGYGHSRAGEFLFGGVTRSFLKECPVSLLITH